jgi:hypothetical protein
MKTKGPGKVQLSWEKVKTRCTFGAKGEEKVHLLRQRNATVSSGPAELSWRKVCGKRRAQAPPTETGRGGEMEASPSSPRKAEVEFKGGCGGYVIIS